MINRSGRVVWLSRYASDRSNAGHGRDRVFKSPLLHRIILIVFDKTTRKPLGMVGERTKPLSPHNLRGVNN